MPRKTPTNELFEELLCKLQDIWKSEAKEAGENDEGVFTTVEVIWKDGSESDISRNRLPACILEQIHPDDRSRRKKDVIRLKEGREERLEVQKGLRPKLILYNGRWSIGVELSP